MKDKLKESKSMKTDFNLRAKPDHLSRAFLGGLLVFGFTSNAPLFFASVVLLHIASSAYEYHRAQRRDCGARRKR